MDNSTNQAGSGLSQWRKALLWSGGLFALIILVPIAYMLFPKPLNTDIPVMPVEIRQTLPGSLVYDIHTNPKDCGQYRCIRYSLKEDKAYQLTSDDMTEYQKVLGDYSNKFISPSKQYELWSSGGGNDAPHIVNLKTNQKDYFDIDNKEPYGEGATWSPDSRYLAHVLRYYHEGTLLLPDDPEYLTIIYDTQTGESYRLFEKPAFEAPEYYWVND